MENPVKSSNPRQFISDYTAEIVKSQDNSALVIRYISESYTVNVFPHCVEYKYRSDNKDPRPAILKKRSKIKGFSNKSRFRLFTCLAKIDNNLAFQPLFVTLTYHHGHQKISSSTKSQLHHFLVALRQYDNDVQFIWRFELQKRGAPHYHLIIFPGNPPFDVDEEKYGIRISNIWHSIADPNSRAHAQYGCKVVNITSYKMACAYLSKYVAKKTDDDDDMENGKHWGNSQNLPYLNMAGSTGPLKKGKAIIEKLRKWLVENGKSQYASPEYFHEKRDQIVFIDSSESLELLELIGDP